MLQTDIGKLISDLVDQGILVLADTQVEDDGTCIDSYEVHSDDLSRIALITIASLPVKAPTHQPVET